MSATVTPISAHPRFRQVAEPWMSKKQIADHYGYSVRWVELRVAEGMPSELIGGQRRFRMSATDKWLTDGGDAA